MSIASNQTDTSYQNISEEEDEQGIEDSTTDSEMDNKVEHFPLQDDERHRQGTWFIPVLIFAAVVTTMVIWIWIKRKMTRQQEVEALPQKISAIKESSKVRIYPLRFNLTIL